MTSDAQPPADDAPVKPPPVGRQRRVGQYQLNQPNMSATGAQPKQRRHTHHSAPPQLLDNNDNKLLFADDTHQRLQYARPPSAPTPPEERRRRHTQHSAPALPPGVSVAPNLGCIAEEGDGSGDRGQGSRRRMRAFSTPDSVARDCAVKQYYHDKMLELRRARNNGQVSRCDVTSFALRPDVITLACLTSVCRCVY